VIILILVTAEKSTGGLLEDEKYFWTGPSSSSKKSVRLPFPKEPFQRQQEQETGVYLSLIAPAYNEEERLPIMMRDTLTYLKARSQADPTFTWEIIIVDDGSKDKTTEVPST
jgi:dolichyl-phosphate beta-glucosyltransferase